MNNFCLFCKFALFCCRIAGAFRMIYHVFELSDILNSAQLPDRPDELLLLINIISPNQSFLHGMRGYIVILLKLPKFEAVFELREALDTLRSLQSLETRDNSAYKQHSNEESYFPFHSNDRSNQDSGTTIKGIDPKEIVTNSGYLRMKPGDIDEWSNNRPERMDLKVDNSERKPSDSKKRTGFQYLSQLSEHNEGYINMTENLSSGKNELQSTVSTGMTQSLIRSVSNQCETSISSLSPLPQDQQIAMQKHAENFATVRQRDDIISSTQSRAEISGPLPSSHVNVSTNGIDDSLEFYIDTEENVEEVAFVQRLRLKINNLTPKIEMHVREELQELLEMHSMLLNAFLSKNLTKILIYFQNSSSKYANYVRCIDYLSAYNKKTSLNVEIIRRLSSYRTFLNNARVDCDSLILRGKCDEAIFGLEKVLKKINDRMVLWNIDQDKVNLLNCGEVLLQGVLEQVDKKMEKIYAILMTEIFLFVEVGSSDYVTHALTEKISYVETHPNKNTFAVSVDAKIGIGTMSLRAIDSNEYDEWVSLLRGFAEQNRNLY